MDTLQKYNFFSPKWVLFQSHTAPFQKAASGRRGKSHSHQSQDPEVPAQLFKASPFIRYLPTAYIRANSWIIFIKLVLGRDPVLNKRPHNSPLSVFPRVGKED